MVLSNSAYSFIECVAQVLNNSTVMIQVLKNYIGGRNQVQA